LEKVILLQKAAAAIVFNPDDFNAVLKLQGQIL
jgi:hypothetical protein